MLVNLEQARKRAKELVRSGRAATLAEAQREIARELGYASWPKLVHAFDRTNVVAALRRARRRARRPRARAARGASRPSGRIRGWRSASATRRGFATAPAPAGRWSGPPLFYVARSRVAVDTVTAAARPARARSGPERPGRRGVDEPLDRVRARRCAARTAAARRGAAPDDNDSLYHSVEPADDACLRLLLERHATVNGTNALHHALDYERLEPVRLLLEHGGDPNESSDWPALHHAVLRGRSPEFVRLLVEHGADPRARDGHGRTAYQHAFRRGRADLATTLEQLGSPTDVQPADRALNAIAAGGDVAARSLDEDAPDVLIELAMSDAETLARVVDAVGPDVQRAVGRRPTRNAAAPGGLVRSPGARRAPPTARRRPERRGRDGVRDADRLGGGGLPLHARPPERQLLGSRRRLRRGRPAPGRRGRDDPVQGCRDVLVAPVGLAPFFDSRARRVESSSESRREGNDVSGTVSESENPAIPSPTPKATRPEDEPGLVAEPARPAGPPPPLLPLEPARRGLRLPQGLRAASTSRR